MYCAAKKINIRCIARSVTRILFVTPIFLTLSGCDLKVPSFGSDDESKRLSPRVVRSGQPVPKGGGRYKVGSPYRIKGKLYVPREVTHYEETGVASWYGELFHGRRTANGEVYDMEALTAAHPTLPLPSYVRVTNLRNGRALVLRVNDRGPYSGSRLIDLSRAAASLLKMERAGTAPVRVQYLGRAPLNGSDRYERDFLARQRWAGPQIAYANSPGKPARRTRSASAQTRQINRKQKAPVNVASVTPGQVSNMRSARTTVPPLPAPRPARMARNTVQPQPPRYKSISVPGIRIANSKPQPNLSTTYYVQAGRFVEKPIADELAAILDDSVAPTSVETAQSGNGFVHLIRVGPFRDDNEAQGVVARIKAAGLKDAYVERFIGG
ncbi:MAG: septal ring lytic transglycosylase RlpA family protein [Hyphomicrobiales bacterium]|nr:septal ring lytic transglycosylase RlpA family protein [Hyphomicrobiales bacterium]